MSIARPDYSFMTRLRITLVLFLPIVGIGGGLSDSLYIILTSFQLFSGFLDRVVFVSVSVLGYCLLGTAIAIVLALAPLDRLIRNRLATQVELFALYLSVSIVVTPASILTLNAIPFAIFDLQLWRNLAILTLSALITMLLTFVVYRILRKIFGASRGLSRAFDWLYQLPRKDALRHLFIWLLVLVSSIYAIDKFLYVYEPFGSGKPNVLLISLDTLGARHMSSYGYQRETTPNLDALARQGVLFEKAFSHSKWTLPSHMSMMTSTYPAVHGVISKESALDSSFVTIAEVLQDNGYYCGAFVDGGRLSHVGSAHGFDQGFDFYEHYPERLTRYEKLFVVKHLLNFLEGVQLRLSVPVMHSERITNGVLTWLDHYSEKRPFFLFLHYYDIHSEAYTKLPYVSPPPYNSMHYPEYEGDFTGTGKSGTRATLYLKEIARRQLQGEKVIDEEDLKYIISLYDGGITYVDHQIGRLLEGLRERRLDENTLVVVTSDHGEEFLEHGLFTHAQYYDEILHVPLIMRLPGKLPENARISALARLIDIVPTVLDILDIEEVDQFEGRSLLSYVGESEEESESLVCFGGLDKTVRESIEKTGLRSVSFIRTETFKLILKKENEVDVIRELYDLRYDPLESANIAEEESEIAQTLEEDLLVWEEACERMRQTIFDSSRAKKVTIDEKTERHLRSLGYIK